MLIFQFLVVLLIVAADQIAKFWIVANVPIYSTIPLIEDVVSIYHTINTGAGWSILSGQRFILIAVPLVAVVAMVYVLVRKKITSKIGTWGVTIILAGAIGNLIDRVFRNGEVVDMIKTEFIDFPVFNVADIAVTVGAILFFVFLIFIYDDKSEKKK